jgi:hypothetical protein
VWGGNELCANDQSTAETQQRARGATQQRARALLSTPPYMPLPIAVSTVSIRPNQQGSHVCQSASRLDCCCCAGAAPIKFFKASMLVVFVCLVVLVNGIFF